MGCKKNCDPSTISDRTRNNKLVKKKTFSDWLHIFYTGNKISLYANT